MNYVKAMVGRGINLNSLSNYELELLELAMKQEKNQRETERERECEQHMRLIAEYTDKLNEFIAELNNNGLVLEYDEYIGKFFIVEGG